MAAVGTSYHSRSDAHFIGRIERGFDFLGYHFSSAGLSVAKQTVASFIEKASRLYERERWTPSGASPLEMYARILGRPGWMMPHRAALGRCQVNG
jgi:hypothetical protein